MSNMRKLVALLAGVAAVAFLIAGCGSSDDSTTDSGSTVTKADFVKQGQAICAAGNKEIEEGFKEILPSGKKPSEDQIAEAMETVLIPSVKKQLGEIEEIGAPEGEDEAVDAFIAGAEGELEKGEEDPQSLASESSFSKTSKEAAALGLTNCAEE